MKRGEVWWADLAEPRGSEPGGRRPVVVVQDDLLNQSALWTVMVVPLTTQMKRAQAAGNLLLQPRESGLDRPSVAVVAQVATLDRDFLVELVGALPRRSLERLDDGLRLALDL